MCSRASMTFHITSFALKALGTYNLRVECHKSLVTWKLDYSAIFCCVLCILVSEVEFVAVFWRERRLETAKPVIQSHGKVLECATCRLLIHSANISVFGGRVELYLFMMRSVLLSRKLLDIKASVKWLWDEAMRYRFVWVGLRYMECPRKPLGWRLTRISKKSNRLFSPYKIHLNEQDLNCLGSSEGQPSHVVKWLKCRRHS